MGTSVVLNGTTGVLKPPAGVLVTFSESLRFFLIFFILLGMNQMTHFPLVVVTLTHLAVD